MIMKNCIKTLALVLALCLLFSLAACSNSPSIAGNWKYTMDFAKAMQVAGGEELASLNEMDASFTKAFEGLSMVIVLDLKPDNTFRFYIDEASARAAVEQMMSKMGELLPSLLSSLAGISEEELREQMTEAGVSMDDLLKQMTEQINTEEMVKNLAEKAKEGTYRYENGKLYLTINGVSENSSNYLTVELSETELRITDVADTEGFQDYKVLLPLVFTK